MDVARTNIRQFEEPWCYNDENRINATGVGEKEDQRKDSRSMQSHLKLTYGHFKFQRKSFGSLSIPFYTVNLFPYINIQMYSHHNIDFLISRKSITFFSSWLRSFL